MSKKSGSKKHGCLRAFLGTLIALVVIVAVVAGLMLSTYIQRGYRVDWTSETVTSNPYIVNQSNNPKAAGPYDTMISAHRAGRTLAPENTLAAFEKCFDNRAELGYTFDVLEFDLHLTKDERLVLLHDDTLDRTSDANEKGEQNVRPMDKNLDELLEYNMAYNFVDPNPNAAVTYPYRGEAPTDEEALAKWNKAVQICTIEQVFDYINSRLTEGETMHYIIEIKDSGSRGQLALDKLYDAMVNYGVLRNTVVGTFNADVTAYIDAKNRRIADPEKQITRSASITEVLSFYFSCMFNADLSKQDLGYRVLQIPYKDFVINLGKPAIIEYAHANGIAVQYWTINEAEDMAYLAASGADCIMTDDPALLYQTIR